MGKKVNVEKNAGEKATFRPLHDNILIERDLADDGEVMSEGSILLPAGNSAPPNTAQVVAVGPDVEGIKAGDTIVVSEFSGSKIIVDDEEFVVVEYGDVLGLYQ